MIGCPGGEKRTTHVKHTYPWSLPVIGVVIGVFVTALCVAKSRSPDKDCSMKNWQASSQTYPDSSMETITLLFTAAFSGVGALLPFHLTVQRAFLGLLRRETELAK